MQEFIGVQATSEAVKPFEVGLTTTYVRTNIKRIESGIWQYDEQQYSNEEYIEAIHKENTLLKAQVEASAQRADFQEDLIAEMAMKVYA